MRIRQPASAGAIVACVTTVEPTENDTVVVSAGGLNEDCEAPSSAMESGHHKGAAVYFFDEKTGKLLLHHYVDE